MSETRLKRSQCRSCGASICWIRLQSGKLAPMDLEHKHTIITRQGFVETGYESHFAHCPNAAQHRRGKGGDGGA